MIIGGNGAVGSNSYNAFETLFGEGDNTYDNAGDFEALLQNLISGQYAKIVLPVYNNIIGDILPVKEALQKIITGDITLKEEGVFECAINHSLIGGSNASLETIDKIYCYPVAADQCRKTLERLGKEEVFHVDTYGSVVDVVGRNLKNEAAIGPHDAGVKLGGKTLLENISDGPSNTTTFKIYSVG